MNRISQWNQQLTSRALDRLGAIPGLTIYGPREAARRTSLVAFNIAGATRSAWRKA
jgi:Selenocysteine lyase